VKVVSTGRLEPHLGPSGATPGLPRRRDHSGVQISLLGSYLTGGRGRPLKEAVRAVARGAVWCHEDGKKPPKRRGGNLRSFLHYCISLFLTVLPESYE
jgi:hypothetical protein